jgi:hypothetical protein
MAPVVAFNKLMVSAPFEIPSSGPPRRSANKVDLPAPFGPTNPIRSPRLTWSETSSKSARTAKDFESCETVSVAEARSVPSFDAGRNSPSRLKSNERSREISSDPYESFEFEMCFRSGGAAPSTRFTPKRGLFISTPGLGHVVPG